MEKHSIFRGFIEKLRDLKTYANVLKILVKNYGHWATFKSKTCIAPDNSPVPWYTYPAIEYLKQFDFSTANIFEYGCGNSSLWWSKRAAKVISVESSTEWHEKINQVKNDNMEILLRENRQDYVKAPETIEGKFDIIIVDGQFRYECVESTINKFAGKGMIIVDNSDWYPEVAEKIREKLDLIQVDFAGFGPVNNYTWVTSVLFSRNVILKPLSKNQPEFCLGGLRQIATE